MGLALSMSMHFFALRANVEIKYCLNKKGSFSMNPQDVYILRRGNAGPLQDAPRFF